MEPKEVMETNNDSKTSPTEPSVVEPCPNQDIVVDYTNVFTTYARFPSREDLCDWVRATGKQHGFVIVTTRSDSGTGKRGPRLYLGCERNGYQRQSKSKVVDNLSKATTEDGRRERGSKKCGCPFRLRGRQVCGDGEWELLVECGVHNHSQEPHLHGHSYVGRLVQEEKEYVLDMSNGNTRPKDILMGLHQKFKDNKSSLKTVYNCRMKNRFVERDGRSQMQQLVSKLIEHGYYYHHRRCESTNTVKDLFFAHPTSVDLLRSFPNVLLIDCTYKINRYNLPLLEIVGVTSTNMTFFVASVYMGFEKQENYIWALTILKALMNQSSLPTVIVTDRELALMNAVEVTFPTSKHFLCRWHINKNIVANCKKMFRTKELWDQFIVAWNMLVVAKTESSYDEYLRRLQSDFSDYPTAVQYVMNQWLGPYKERFVSCWTNNVMHFDNNTTSRVESQHLALKRQLQSSQGDFETCWKQIHTLIETSHIAIKGSFAKSRTMVLQKFKSVLFQQLRGLVSIIAMDKIYDQMNSLPEDGHVDPLLCGCVLRKTCGLPCAHEIAEYLSNDVPIPIDQVNAFWRKLDMLPAKIENVDISVTSEMETRLYKSWEHVVAKFHEAAVPEKLLILKRMMEVAEPVTTSLIVPHDETRTRGRPKPPKAKKSKSTKRDPSLFEYVESMKDSCSPCDQGLVYEVGPSQQPPTFTTVPQEVGPSQQPPTFKTVPQPRTKMQVVRQRTRAGMATGHIAQFPKRFHEYITDTVNVAADGHCGFRTIARLLFQNENSWSRVRSDLSQELMKNQELYARVFIEHKRVEKVKNRLKHHEETAAKKYWFDANDMWHLVASFYNRVLLVLDSRHCFTYLPLRTAPPIDPKLICIGIVNGDHFIQVNLRQGCPLAPVPIVWDQNRVECAASWKSIYSQQLLSYSESVENERFVLKSSDSINLDE